MRGCLLIAQSSRIFTDLPVVHDVRELGLVSVPEALRGFQHTVADVPPVSRTAFLDLKVRCSTN
jgi:hypothetical protein